MIVRTTVKSIQDVMRQDVGVDGDAQRISQLTWLFFLKIIDDQDQELELTRDGYRSPIPEKFPWRHWAADPEGITGQALLDFVNDELFPALKGLQITGKPGDRRRVVRDVFEDAYPCPPPRSPPPRGADARHRSRDGAGGMSTTTERFIRLYEDLVEEVNRRAGAAWSHSFEIEQASIRDGAVRRQERLLKYIRDVRHALQHPQHRSPEHAVTISDAFLQEVESLLNHLRSPPTVETPTTRVGAAFVTASGKAAEPLQRLITPWDVLATSAG